MASNTESLIALSGKYLFVFYLVLSSNYLGSTFGCKIQDLLKNSMITKHTLGLLTLYFFNTLTDSQNQQSALEKLIYSIGLYILYLLSTRMNMSFFLAFIVCLGVSYSLYIVKDEYKENEELQQIAEISQTVLVILSGVILIIGFIYYFIEKKQEYGPKFRIDTFILGSPECRHSNEPILE